MEQDELKRPTPEQLLNLIKKEEDQRKRQKGYLKIFLGYVAGVGKTFRMLNEAQGLRARGEDIVVGVVETHKRAETESLLKDLEIIPRKELDYAGITIDEMNIDAILQRKPNYVLVDELAHTNAPTSRHTKRYQDIEELLEAGINVYTTLNIQHLESVNDIVFQISGIQVKETVPDRIIELADKIELVDLPVEELLQRLSEGKVYIPEKAKQATMRFFKAGNLMGLRELALRCTAKRVDVDMLTYMEDHGITGPWPVDSRLLVCVSPSPTSEQLIRITHRFAENLNAEWAAIYVEPSHGNKITDNNKLRLEKNLNLAEKLGGRVTRLISDNPAEEIVSYAKTKNITLIIMGYSKKSRLEEFIRGSVINDIIHKSSPIQILVVEGSVLSQSDQSYKSKVVKEEKKKKIPWRSFYLSFFSISLTTAIGFLLTPILTVHEISLIFLIPIVLNSVLTDITGGIFSSFLASLFFDFFFVPPIFSFTVNDVRFLPIFITLFLVGIIVSFLANRVKQQSESARNREKFISYLYEFSRDLLSALSLEHILNRATQNISDLFSSDVIIILPDNHGRLINLSKNKDQVIFDDHDLSIASWVYTHKKPAGKGSDTFVSSPWYYIPLLGKQEKIIGVLAIKSKDNSELSLEQEQLLHSFSSVVSLALGE